LVGLQSCCGQFGEEKKLLSLPWSFEAIGHSLATVLAELSQLLGKCVMMTNSQVSTHMCREAEHYNVAHHLTWPKRQIVICQQAGVSRDENSGEREQ